MSKQCFFVQMSRPTERQRDNDYVEPKRPKNFLLTLVDIQKEVRVVRKIL